MTVRIFNDLRMTILENQICPDLQKRAFPTDTVHGSSTIGRTSIRRVRE